MEAQSVLFFLVVAMVGGLVGAIPGAVVGCVIRAVAAGEGYAVVRNCGIVGAVLGTLAALVCAVWVIASLPGIIALP